MKKLLLAIVCVFVMFGTLKAQNEVVVDGTVGNYAGDMMHRFAPVFVAVQYSVSQQYYTAEEIGKIDGFINSVAFKTDYTWYEGDPRRVEVYLINSETAVFDGLDMVQVTAADRYFSGNLTFGANQWVSVEFEKSFEYTGKNVLVCVCDLTGEADYYDSYFASFSVPQEEGVRCLWSSDEEMFLDPTAGVITAKEISTIVPYVKFVFGEKIEGTESIVENEVSFNVYPNPVENQLFVEVEENVVEVSVYDLCGRQQVTMTPCHQDEVRVDVSDLNSGVYFVKVRTENGETVKRFVKK